MQAPRENHHARRSQTLRLTVVAALLLIVGFALCECVHALPTLADLTFAPAQP
jgi:hypothetical protein